MRGDFFKKFPRDEIERDVRTTLIDIHLNQIESLGRRREPRARIGNMDGEIAPANRQTEISGGDIRDLGLMNSVIKGMDAVIHMATLRITACAEKPPRWSTWANIIPASSSNSSRAGRQRTPTFWAPATRDRWAFCGWGGGASNSTVRVPAARPTVVHAHAVQHYTRLHYRNFVLERIVRMRPPLLVS